MSRTVSTRRRYLLALLPLAGVVSIATAGSPATSWNKAPRTKSPAQPARQELTTTVCRGGVCLDYYFDQAAFRLAAPGACVEDFQGAQAYLTNFPAPLDSTSSNPSFSPGDILPGASYVDVPLFSSGFFVVPGGVFTATDFLANATGADTQALFSPSVSSAGLIVVSSDSGPLTVTFLGAGGPLDAPQTVPSNSFVGVVSPAPIVGIDVLNPRTGLASGIDDVTYVTPVCSPSCAPEWTNCPASTYGYNDPGQCGAVFSWTPPTLDQSQCGEPLTGPPTSNFNPGDFFPVGTTTVTYTAETITGGVATCSFDIQVLDNEAPVVDCPPEFWRVQCNDPLGYVYRPYNYGGYVENCPAPFFYGHDYPFGVSGPWEIYAVDRAGNESNHCEFMIEVVGDIPGPARPQSDPALDGVVRESKVASRVGGSISSATNGAAVGDDSGDRQSQAIFSFDLSNTPIPADALITRAYVRLTQTGWAGSPELLGPLTADHSASYFGTGPGLAITDFEATDNGVTPNMVTFPLPGSNGASSFGDIDASNFPRLNRTGMNQFRLHFARPWVRTGIQDSLTFATGEWTNAPPIRPELVVEYYLQACNPCNLPGAGGPSTASASLLSTAFNDGYVRESHWTSGVGGTAISTGSYFDVGDTTAREQMLGVLSFDTSSIPANAKITSAQLQIRRIGATGNAASLGSLVADMKCGGVFGTQYLDAQDFQAYAQFQQVASFPLPTANGQTVSAGLSYDGMNAIQKGAGAITQFKVRFTTPDNGNAIADYYMFGTGEAGVGSQPKLVVTYEY